MAKLELEQGTDVLLLETGDALLLEGITTFDETNRLVTALIVLTNYQLDIKLLLETGDALLLETGDTLLIERSATQAELTESNLALLLALLFKADQAELSETELTLLLVKVIIKAKMTFIPREMYHPDSNFKPGVPRWLLDEPKWRQERYFMWRRGIIKYKDI